MGIRFLKLDSKKLPWKAASLENSLSTELANVRAQNMMSNPIRQYPDMVTNWFFLSRVTVLVINNGSFSRTANARFRAFVFHQTSNLMQGDSSGYLFGNGRDTLIIIRYFMIESLAFQLIIAHATTSSPNLH